MIKADVSVVAKGYRASKLIGSGVVNDKNEKIGTLDDIIVDHSTVMAWVRQGHRLQERRCFRVPTRSDTM